MPIHDWTRVDAGLFHAFHQSWIISLSNALNAGGLPPDYFALPEQSIRGPVPDVLTLRLSSSPGDVPEGASPGIAVAEAPPRTHLIRRSDRSVYAHKADRITVRHRHGEVVAVIEILSPGNKASISELRAFVQKASSLIQQGVHLLVVDLFPPTARDPQGIHKAIWDELDEETAELPAERPLVVASYDAGPPQTAYVENLAVGDTLPEMPLFLRPEFYVPVPLELTYATSWDAFPGVLKRLLLPNAGESSPGS